MEKKILSLSVFMLVILRTGVISAQENCRFPVDFDNFNSFWNWKANPNGLFYRPLAFGIIASESWCVEFKLKTGTFPDFQTLFLGLGNDSLLEISDHLSVKNFAGIQINSSGFSDHEANSRECISISSTDECAVPQVTLPGVPDAFLRLERINPSLEAISFYRDEDMTDLVTGSLQYLKVNTTLPALNSFCLFLFPQTPDVQFQSLITELRFFNNRIVLYPQPDTNQSGFKTNQNRRSLGVIPNPSQGIFGVELDDKETPARIEIYDMFGRLVEEWAYPADCLRGNFLAYPRGWYFIRAVQGEEYYFTKFILN